MCPRCAGLGHVRGVESLGLAVLRLLEEEATKERVAQLIVQLPIPVATFMLNEKRTQLDAIEQRHAVRLLLIPNPHLDTPHYDIERVEANGKHSKASHHLLKTPEADVPEALQDKPEVEQAAVKGVSPSAPAPVINNNQAAVQVKKPNLLTRLLNVITGKSADEEKVVEEKAEEKPKREQNNRRPNNNRNRNNNNRRGAPRRRPNANTNNNASADNKASNDKQAETKKPAETNKPAPSANTAEKDNGQTPRNPNAKRSRRGGRRRPRTENTTPVAEDAGNKVQAEKKEVVGNVKKEASADINGNNVPSDNLAKEVDGNKPVAEKKTQTRKPRANNNQRRRKPAVNKNKPANEKESTTAEKPVKVETEKKTVAKKVAPKKTGVQKAMDNASADKPKAKTPDNASE